MPEAAAEPARRGRPRSEKARQAIVEAAAELMLVRGLGAVSMDAVAERAGVSKATIYRWWASKETLALDALYHEWEPAGQSAGRGSGSLRDELLEDLGLWVQGLRERPQGHVIAALLAEAHMDPAFAAEYGKRFIAPRREYAAAMFARAIDRGEIASGTDVGLALDLLYGPLYHRLLHAHAPLDESFVEDLVDAVLLCVTSPRKKPLDDALRPLTVDDVLMLQREGAQILDTRDAYDFARGHLAGAVNVGLGGSYLTWCSTLLDCEGALVIVAEPGREQEVAARLGRVGFESLEGYAGDMQAFEPFPDCIAHVERLTAAVLAERLESDEPPLVVDVRTQREWCERRIGATLNVPLTRLTEQLDELPNDRPLVVHCAEGYRSAIAASLLLRAGFSGVGDLVGGLASWQSSNLETVGAGAG